jgi:hypothetical protein
MSVKTRVVVRFFAPFPMRVDRVHIDPVIERGLCFQRKRKRVELEADQRTRRLQPRVALGLLRFTRVSVREGSALRKDLDSYYGFNPSLRINLVSSQIGAVKRPPQKAAAIKSFR